MEIVQQASLLRPLLSGYREQGLSCGFVPTMGNLHAGHLALVDAAAEQCDKVIVSIFVNPMQFGPEEDLASYPNTPGDDEKALIAHGASLLYRPPVEDVYPVGLASQTRVEVPALSDILCGETRPGHFIGVTTVVNRLFNLVPSEKAFFGKKDYQQYLLIRKMVSDLAMNIDVIGVDTVRYDSGLAMSSRNNYLSDSEQIQAAGLYRVLQDVARNYQADSLSSSAVQQAALAELEKIGFKPDYLSVRRQSDLNEPRTGDLKLVVLAAVWLGSTRLIDNLEFDLA